jgi:outer membrane protein assembly factor BamB
MIQDWRSFRGNPGFTGATASRGPTHGRIVWRAPAGRQWYSAPVIHRGLAIVTCPGRLGRKMMAVALPDGVRRWELTDGISDRMRMSSPIVIDGDTGWVRGLNHDGIFGIDLATGAFQTEHTEAGVLDYRAHPQPVLGGGPGHLLFPAGTRSHTGADPNRTDTGIWHTVVHMAPDGSQRWQFRCGQFFAQPFMAAGRVIIVSHDGIVFALDPDLPEDETAAIGTASAERIVWQYTAGARTATTPAVIGGRLICPLDDGRVLALDAASGELLWDRQVYTPNASMFQQAAEPIDLPAGILVAAADGSLTLLDPQSGEARRRAVVRDAQRGSPHAKTAAVLRSRPVALEGHRDGVAVACASLDGSVHLFHADTLRPLWERPITEWMITAPLAAGDGCLLVITNDMVLHALDGADGTTRWSVPMVDYPQDWVAFDEFQASPQVSGNTVYIASPGHMVSAFSARTDGQAETSSQPASGPSGPTGTNEPAGIGHLLWRHELAGELPTDSWSSMGESSSASRGCRRLRLSGCIHRRAPLDPTPRTGLGSSQRCSR